jgi:hypothetical protein
MKKIIIIALLAVLSLSVKAQKWKYSTKVDEMTSDKLYFATIDSEPDNSTHTGITVRYSEGKNQVILSIEHGMFNIEVSGYITNTKVYVKFDDGNIETFYADPAKDNVYNLLFLHRANNFIKKLKASKKIFIKTEVYSKGSMIFSFNTDGLQWDH